MNYVLSSLIGYLLGSFPTGYILLKKNRDINILQKGTGNVGALNVFRVSNSRLLGIIVLVIDLIKGFISVYTIKLLFPDDFILYSLSLLFATLAHCYSPWIKFAGGRGLATGAGGLIIFIPHLIFIWIFFWVIGFAFKKNIAFANGAAIILTAVLSFSSRSILFKYSFPGAETPLIYGMFVIMFFLLLLTKQIQPLKDYFKEQRKKIIRNSFYEKK